MADIRINALATTAASTASDDFVAVDGSANGTRKLNAYSPTFGGNLTVSGTGTTGGNLRVRNALGYATGIHTGTTSDSTQQLLLSSNAAYNHAYISKGSTTLGIGFSSDNGSFVADDSITITAATKLVTLTGNLTVSGTGTSSVAGNLGIGTTSPLGVLDVRSTTPDVLFNGKDTADPVLYFGRYQYDNVSKSGAAIKYVHGSAGGSQEYGRLAFLTATGSFGALTERMRINESGNVLIGTTTDGGQKLQVSGTANLSSGSSANTLSLISTDSTAYSATGYNSAYRVWLYGNGATNAYNFIRFSGGGSNEAAFGTVQNASGRAEFVWQTYDGSAYGERLRIASGGDATFAGTVKIANTAQIKGVYTTTTTFDFGTIANNDASSVCTLTMTGVSSSDSIIVSPTDGDNFPQFCTVSAVPSGNSVSVRLYNGSGSSRTVGSRTIRVTAIKF